MYPQLSYTHMTCRQVTVVPLGAAEQFQRDPDYARERFPQSPNYKLGTWCAHCKKYRLPTEFVRVDGSPLLPPPPEPEPVHTEPDAPPE